MLPFLKWAGGKRWLFDARFVNGLPAFRRYIEPFLGGGAGFFAISPKIAILSDVNADLIELYQVVRDFPQELLRRLVDHQKGHCKEYYYRVRSEAPDEIVDRAARTLYLNRTCWNGLYRLNRNGIFNVPIGTKTAVVTPDEDFSKASAILKNADLRSCDFELTIDRADTGDLLFVDPPYTTKHDMNGFVKYNENIFAWSDQVRLREALGRAAQRGASIILTNANHSSLHDLYDGFGTHVKVPRHSVISGKSAGRSGVFELMVRL